MPDIVETSVAAAMEHVNGIGCDTQMFTQAQSKEFYERVAEECRTMAEAITDDIDAGRVG